MVTVIILQLLRGFSGNWFVSFDVDILGLDTNWVLMYIDGRRENND